MVILISVSVRGSRSLGDKDAVDIQFVIIISRNVHGYLAVFLN